MQNQITTKGKQIKDLQQEVKHEIKIDFFSSHLLEKVMYVFLVYKVRSVVDLPHQVGSSKMDKGEVIRATNCCNLQRNIVALQVKKRYVARITTHLANIVTQQTDFIVAS